MKVQEQSKQLQQPMLRQGTMAVPRQSTLIEGGQITEEGKAVKAIRGGGARRQQTVTNLSLS